MSCGCQKIGKMKLKLGKVQQPLEVVVGGTAGYFIADKVADKVIAKLDESNAKAGKTLTPEQVTSREMYVNGGKIAAGVAIVAFVPKKWKFGFESAVNALGVGMALNGAVKIVQAKKWFGVSGNMRIVHKKVAGTTNNDGRVIAGTTNNQQQVINGTYGMC